MLKNEEEKSYLENLKLPFTFEWLKDHLNGEGSKEWQSSARFWIVWSVVCTPIIFRRIVSSLK